MTFSPILAGEFKTNRKLIKELYKDHLDELHKYKLLFAVCDATDIADDDCDVEFDYEVLMVLQHKENEKLFIYDDCILAGSLGANITFEPYMTTVYDLERRVTDCDWDFYINSDAAMEEFIQFVRAYSKSLKPPAPKMYPKRKIRL